MRICVYGAGAIGGNFATRLAASGSEVSVVRARRASSSGIDRAEGLTMLSGERTVVAKVAASGDPADLGPQDAVLVTLKSSGQRTLADSIGPLLRDDTDGRLRAEQHPWWYGDGLNGRPKAPDLPRLDPGGADPARGRDDAPSAPSSPRRDQVIAPGVVRNISPGRNTLWIAEVDDRLNSIVLGLRWDAGHRRHRLAATTDIRYDIWNKLMSRSQRQGTQTLILREKEPVLSSPINQPAGPARPCRGR